MWFDARTQLSKIMAEIPPDRPASQLSLAPAPAQPLDRVAVVAKVAAFPVNLPPETFPHGTACGLGLSPLTWTGRVVSLEEWRRLTEWERNGPQGKHWNGSTRRWEDPG